MSGTVEQICVNDLLKTFFAIFSYMFPKENEPAWRGCSSSVPKMMDTQEENENECMCGFVRFL